MLLLFSVLIASSIATEPTELDFLRTMQTNSGAFVTNTTPSADGKPEQPTLRTTRTAIRAFRLLGSTVPNQDKIRSFLDACYDDRTGGFRASPSLPPDPISTAVALMILKELQLPNNQFLKSSLLFINNSTKDFEEMRMVASGFEELECDVPNAAVWLRQLKKEFIDRKPASIFESARMTALQAVAIQRLGGDIEPAVIDEVLDGQRPDGGFGAAGAEKSDLESCYRVVRLFNRAGVHPKDRNGLLAYIKQCRNSDGGFGRRPGEPSSLHGTYYATIIRLWLNDQDHKAARYWSLEDQDTNRLPHGWSESKTLDAPGSRWIVAEVPVEKMNRVIRQVSSEGPKKQFNLCVRSERFKDLVFSAGIRSVGGEIDQGGGLVWRYQDQQNYYITRWNPLEHNMRLYKVVNGVRSQMDTAQVGAPSGHWQYLRVVQLGRDIRCYFNDKLTLEAEDDQFSSEGRFGLWTKSDAVSEFDEIRIREAVESDLEEME